MKKFFIILVAGVIGLSAMGLSGCKKYPDEISFIDFPQFTSFNENIVNIVVNWDNNDGNYVVYSITDKDTINNIVSELVNETKFLKADSDMNDSGHSSVVLKDADNIETVIMLNQIQYGTKKQYYNYENANFYNFIKQTAQNMEVLD